MDAKEYLKKCLEICEIYEEEGCKGCPLKEHVCGISKEAKDINTTIDVVEKYERPNTAEQREEKNIREAIKLLEAAAEEIENCHERETELSGKIRDFAKQEKR